MVWLYGILIFICLLLTWLLIAPVELEIDSRNASAEFRWLTVGFCRIYWQQHWQLQFKILFYQKHISLSAKQERSIKKKAVKKKTTKKHSFRLEQIFRVLKSFTVKEFYLSVDSSNYILTAYLYPLNFFPLLQGHININFLNEDYLHLTITNRPVKILAAFFR